MMAAVPPCRIYIVYHHGLFAQGVRSVLEAQRAVQILGMESDVVKALKAVESLKPEVIIVEESTGMHQRMRLGAFLKGPTGGRVVTLSLDHEYTTMYERRRVAASDPADLVKAIQGLGKPNFPGPDQLRPKVTMLCQPESDRDADAGPSGQQTRVRCTRRQGTHVSAKLPRTSRGSAKGG
jgi:DNA-binding NarL/FixJ family response regulator